MQKQIDMNSDEFKNEFNKTQNFTDKVCKNFGFVYNPSEELNQTIQEGLTRHKLIYGKRYCPCFLVLGATKEQRDKEDNRICPCKPALEVEIPRDGKCHCGIFCTQAHAKELKEEMGITK